jgi:uncharacterized protein (TIGR02246 family)
MRPGPEPILPVHDVGRVRAFYESLGFTAGYGFGFYEILRRDNLVVHIEQHDGLVPAANHSSCYWRVADADALYQEFAILGLPSDGVPCLTRPFDEAWGMREFQIKDPAGNLIRIGHELPHAEEETEHRNGDTELVQLEERLADAWVKGDRAYIEDLLSADWTVTDPSGQVLTKQQVLNETFSSTERRIDAMTIDEIRVRWLGPPAAVVTGRTQARGSDRGQTMSVTLRFTDVFRIRDGRWQIVASHGTLIAPPTAILVEQSADGDDSAND